VCKPIELTGKRFGRWTVTAHVGGGRWSCTCDCGTRRDVLGANLRNGRSKSCTCLSKELNSAKRLIDLTGKRFGRWTVIAYVGGPHAKWSCVCTCGERRDVIGKNLRNGTTKSCRCWQRDSLKARLTRHGMSRSKEYRTWASMKQRCFNPRHSSFEYYGDRGILPSEDWLSFIPYFADTGPQPPGLSLDRIDVNGGYGCTNWRWADAKQQVQNRRPPRPRRMVKRRQPKKPPPLEDPPF
jgi:hypothetical protein